MTGRLKLVARSAATLETENLARQEDTPKADSLKPSVARPDGSTKAEPLQPNLAQPAGSASVNSNAATGPGLSVFSIASSQALPGLFGSAPSRITNPNLSRLLDKVPTPAGNVSAEAAPAPMGDGSGEAAPSTSTTATQPTKHGSMLLNLIKFSLLGVLLIAGTVGAYNSYNFFSTHEETDDATVTGHMHLVSARVSGNVNQVLVDDNQHVQKGQVLLRLDPDDYSVLVQQAQAALELAKRQAEVSRMRIGESSETASAQNTRASGDVTESQSSLQNFKEKVTDAEAGVAGAKEQVAQWQAMLEKNLIDYKRYALLENQGAVSTQQLDSAKRDYTVSQAAERGAQDSLKQSESRLVAAKEAVNQAAAHVTSTSSEVHQARASDVQIKAAQMQYEADLAAVKQNEAKLKDAMLQQSYTTIVAPVSGTVGAKSVEAGQQLQPGQQIMAIVPDDYWVVANFKETQLERMHDGQPVEIKVDAFPHHIFTGHVDSVSPASGAQFALLPPDNATGNFTKIVQRVPVKILFDSQSIKGFESRIAPGMSVIAEVSITK